MSEAVVIESSVLCLAKCWSRYIPTAHNNGTTLRLKHFLFNHVQCFLMVITLRKLENINMNKYKKETTNNENYYLSELRR